MPQTLRVRFTTDDASDTTPTWTTATTDVRAFSISRGRDSELSRVEAGTAQIILNNRSRTYDPTLSSSIRPMNRWWIEDTLTGETLYLGYATRYEMQWPTLSNKDAVTVVSCVDELMVLALDKLPVMNPPTVSTYADVVQFDQPQGYWQLQGLQDVQIMAPTVGPTSFAAGTMGRAASAIVGDDAVENLSGTLYGARSTTAYIYTIESADVGTPGLTAGGPGDAGGLSAFTVELWFKSSEATPATTRAIATGPQSASTFHMGTQPRMLGKISGYAKNSGGTLYYVTGATSIAANTWYHVVLVIESGGFTTLYINGAVDNFTAFTGAIGAMDPTAYMWLGDPAVVGGTRYFDEVAFYRYDVPAARVLAHYQAGALRGFPSQDPGDRIDAILDASTSVAARSISPGGRTMPPTFMHGQSPLEELRIAESASNVDAFLFIAKDGTITFLDAGHRSIAPWNTVQCTFDDDGTDLKYGGLTMDRSDSFLANDIQVSRVGGEVDSSTDATSITTFLTRPLQLTNLPLTLDTDVADIGNALLAKYKDPMTRITSLTAQTSTSALTTALLGLELGDRIRVLHTQPNGGRIDQTLFVQRIQIEGRPGVPWIITLGVSPL